MISQLNLLRLTQNQSSKSLHMIKLKAKKLQLKSLQTLKNKKTMTKNNIIQAKSRRGLLEKENMKRQRILRKKPRKKREWKRSRKNQKLTPPQSVQRSKKS